VRECTSLDSVEVAAGLWDWVEEVERGKKERKKERGD